MKFGTYDWSLKAKRYVPCSSSMVLWYGLYFTAITVGQARKVSRTERLDILRAFPNSTNACRCPNCRYHRMYKNLSTKVD